MSKPVESQWELLPNVENVAGVWIRGDRIVASIAGGTFLSVDKGLTPWQLREEAKRLRQRAAMMEDIAENYRRFHE